MACGKPPTVPGPIQREGRLGGRLRTTPLGRSLHRRASGWFGHCWQQPQKQLQKAPNPKTASGSRDPGNASEDRRTTTTTTSSMPYPFNSRHELLGGTAGFRAVTSR